jgi:hypothetical protein
MQKIGSEKVKLSSLKQDLAKEPKLFQNLKLHIFIYVAKLEALNLSYFAHLNLSY